MKFLRLMNYPKNLVVFRLVLEKKQELMEKTPGEYSEFINLKKLNNL